MTFRGEMGRPYGAVSSWWTRGRRFAAGLAVGGLVGCLSAFTWPSPSTVTVDAPSAQKARLERQAAAIQRATAKFRAARAKCGARPDVVERDNCRAEARAIRKREIAAASQDE
jgi:hypothetical protein